MSDSEEINITGEDDETEIDDSLSEETGVTDDESATEGTTETETEGTTTTETHETTEDETDTDSTQSSQPSVRAEGVPAFHLRPQDILSLPGRHIKAEDFEWGKSPIPALSDIIIENVAQIGSSHIEKLLTIATTEQRNRILEILPLDLPVTVTLPLLEEEIYWKRMCLRSWPAYDVWRYSNNWKSMFVHRTVQELIEDFVPGENNIFELCETLKIFRNFVIFLEIRKLSKVKEKTITIDLLSEDFDEHLDEIISAPTSQIYLDFEKVLECVTHLQDLRLILSPKFIDHEDFHINIADFNSLFKGLQRLKELKKFRISNAILTLRQITIVLKTFLTHSFLTELNLSYNFIDNSVCDYVGKLLISECPLEILILKYNKITDDGVKSIAAALFENSKLKKLDISLNMVGDEGGIFLARVLRFNKSITDLDVSKNKMTAEAGLFFANLVRFSDDLRSLKIQENYLGESAGKLFTEAIGDNQKLLELDVHYCGFSSEDEGLIHTSILRNRLKAPYFSYVRMNNNKTASEFLF